MLDEVGQALRTRHLWREYHCDWWQQQEYPAPVLDQMLELDAIANVVAEERRAGH